MKKRLIVGDGNSIHIQNLAKQIKISSPDSRLDLLNTSKNKYLGESDFDNIYEQALFQLWTTKFTVAFSIIWTLVTIRWYLFRKNKTHYDVIQIHYVNLIHKYAINFLKKSGVNIVACFWGSDIFLCKKKSNMKKLLSKCDQITYTTPKMKSEIFNLLDCDNKQLIEVKFGLPQLDFINEVDKQSWSTTELDNITIREIAKQAQDKHIITIGYNASSHQQHQEIIASLSNLSSEEKKGLFFVFPMTYGREATYIDSIKRILSETDLNYLLLEEYLSNENCAILVMLTDIFVQLQITDALSGAMQEHLYAGNIVITGTWLDYELLVNYGVEFHNIDNIMHLYSKLSSLTPLLAKEKYYPSNKQKIGAISAYSSVIDRWLSL